MYVIGDQTNTYYVILNYINTFNTKGTPKNALFNTKISFLAAMQTGLSFPEKALVLLKKPLC